MTASRTYPPRGRLYAGEVMPGEVSVTSRRIVYLDQVGEPYSLTRATASSEQRTRNVNDDCTGTSWLTLGQGPQQEPTT